MTLKIGKRLAVTENPGFRYHQQFDQGILLQLGGLQDAAIGLLIREAVALRRLEMARRRAWTPRISGLMPVWDDSQWPMAVKSIGLKAGQFGQLLHLIELLEQHFEMENLHHPPLI